MTEPTTDDQTIPDPADDQTIPDPIEDDGQNGEPPATVNPLTLLPARARRAVYVGYGMASMAGSATTAYFVATGMGLPSWLVGGLAALGALAAPVGVLAATNIHRVNGV